MSLNMLIETKAGYNYTVDDCEGWFSAAGFNEVRNKHLSGPEVMVVAGSNSATGRCNDLIVTSGRGK